MAVEIPVHVLSGDLSGLVAVQPELTGVPFWIWCWQGGVLKSAEPTVLVTPKPRLIIASFARVALYPEIAVIGGPAIEVDEEFERLVVWLEANRDAISDYWFRQDAASADDLLALLQPIPQMLESAQG